MLEKAAVISEQELTVALGSTGAESLRFTDIVMGDRWARLLRPLEVPLLTLSLRENVCRACEFDVMQRCCATPTMITHRYSTDRVLHAVVANVFTVILQLPSARTA